MPRRKRGHHDYYWTSYNQPQHNSLSLRNNAIFPISGLDRTGVFIPDPHLIPVEFAIQGHCKHLLILVPGRLSGTGTASTTGTVRNTSDNSHILCTILHKVRQTIFYRWPAAGNWLAGISVTCSSCCVTIRRIIFAHFRKQAPDGQKETAAGQETVSGKPPRKPFSRTVRAAELSRFPGGYAH